LLAPAQSARVDVVLVSPRNPLNIGAAARAMANFGFHRLSIVAPFAHNWMEAKSAVGAPDLLREAKVYDTLAEAVAHCTLILGTGSLDRRKPVQATLGLPEAAAQIRAALKIHEPLDSVKGTGFSPYINPAKTSRALAPEANSGHIAIVFGSEKHGLTAEDLSWCHALIVIDTCEAQPSMNLGQAVAVCLYEISRTPESGPNAAKSLTPQPLVSAESAQLDRLAALVEETMEAVNYSTRGIRSANGQALRVLLRRLMPNDADLRRMMGLFRRILWQLGRSRDRNQDKV
jgi:tRNA C32,U32 (ribose-2'-O)-methylase TrmJ